MNGKTAIPVHLILVFLAAVILILFTYFTPPLLDQTALKSTFLGRLPGDLGTYCARFFLSFVLLGLFPLAGALAAGFGPRDLGIRFAPVNLKLWLFLVFLGIALGAGVISAFNARMAAYYPYSKTIASYVKAGNSVWLLYHALMYFFLYYVPWEILFRGFMIFPLLRTLKIPESDWRISDPKTAAIVSLQAIPSALLHFGHPLAETFSAVVFGLFAGWLAVRTRSILPGLILHAAVGIALDFTIMII